MRDYYEFALWSHAALLSPLDRRNDVTNIVQTIKDTGDVGTLLSLHLVHKGTYIVWHRIHTKSVQSTVEHVGLDTHLIERLAECTNCIIRILTSEEVYLLETATIPSIGTFSPGCTTMTEPISTSSGSTCSSFPSCSIFA